MKIDESVVLSVYVATGDRSSLSKRLTGLLSEAHLPAGFDVALVGEMAAEIADSNAVAGGLAIFVDRDGTEVVELPYPIEDQAIVDRQRQLRPMHARRSLRTAVVVASHERVDVYIKRDARLARLATLSGEPERKPNYGGWHGYEERKTWHRADGHLHKLMTEVSQLLLHVHEGANFDLVVGAGPAEVLDAFELALHPYLRSLATERFPTDAHRLRLAVIKDRVGSIEKAHLKREDERLQRDLLAEVAKRGRAVIGRSGVFNAANSHAIKTLVLAGPVKIAGAACQECGWLGLESGPCHSCGAPVTVASDVLDRLLRATTVGGGVVRVIDTDSGAQGVAAEVRFEVSRVG